MTRTIVLFADGTGNAFSTRAITNVRRLYQALDNSDPDQVSYYIPGVGTSEFRPWAIFDGATGVGVPSNVRLLYRFLCDHYEPHAEIYMFGFSRGAFTIRTLIGLVKTQGLVALYDNKERERSEADKKFYSECAYRAYRAPRRPIRERLGDLFHF